MIGAVYRSAIDAVGHGIRWPGALRRACPSQATPNPGALGRKHAATVVPRAAPPSLALLAGALAGRLHALDEAGPSCCMPAQSRCRARLLVDSLRFTWRPR